MRKPASFPTAGAVPLATRDVFRVAGENSRGVVLFRYREKRCIPSWQAPSLIDPQHRTSTLLLLATAGQKAFDRIGICKPLRGAEHAVKHPRRGKRIQCVPEVSIALTVDCIMRVCRFPARHEKSLPSSRRKIVLAGSVPETGKTRMMQSTVKAIETREHM